ncbi:GGDEF domain-containing protein [Denitrificimonas caeni]|uniref:GGDEF domain-containing protein n=1 Tax=Denitrificimonas caeni TaxID=521720 RepID=UPI001965D65E|nr:GGDEF domain-containing protein [Denitrificimonas caeni]
MNTQPTSNVVNLEPTASAHAAVKTDMLPLIALSHEELRQLLVTQLQTTLDITTLLTLFFKSTQRLVQYASLSYKQAEHEVSVELGVPQEHSINYGLSYQGEFLGHIVFTRDSRFSEQELGDFESVISSLIFPLRNGLLYAAALQSALKDPLTGVGNRFGMQQTLQRDIDTAHRHKQALSVLMIDIDYFKRINDSYGHSVGDLVLVQVAQHIQKQLRSTDALFRYGGEEFLAVLPHTDEQDAMLVAQRLCESIEGLLIKHVQHSIQITASIGCAALTTQETLQRLLQRSDIALYAAKHSGRNQVQLAP